jgi:hypothetical protein
MIFSLEYLWQRQILFADVVCALKDLIRRLKHVEKIVPGAEFVLLSVQNC